MEWLAERLIEREARYVNADCRAEIQRMGRQIRARRPIRRRSAVSSRMGLSPDQRTTVLSLIEPDAERNPFSADVRARNWLIVRLLYDLGLRQGELLSIQISDIDFSTNNLVIARRHDAKEDPRVNQPSVKTLDSKHPLERWLADAIHDYIMGSRRSLPRARRHPYLFVTHKYGPHCGQPLSNQGVGKLFRKLREAAPESLSNLSAHVLRHTWNDRFSEWADENNIDPAKEEKMRSHLMGWREGSGTAETYTRRHRERQAQEAALRLQRDSRDDQTRSE